MWFGIWPQIRIEFGAGSMGPNVIRKMVGPYLLRKGLLNILLLG